MMPEELDYVTWLPLIMAVAGACIGSFLNVVIYRMPRGIGLGRPARSFCPMCGKGIPWHLNVPLLSWLMLRGRSACCGQRIPVRYWLVEAACAGLFYALSRSFIYEPITALLGLCIWGACMLALLAMDWEQMVVEPRVAIVAALCGAAVGYLDPTLADAAAHTPWNGLQWSIIGALGGYAFFRLIALGGSLLFGRRAVRFPKPEEFYLHQEGEDIVLEVGQERFLWSEVFLEGADKIILQEAAAQAAADAPQRGLLTLTATHAVLPGGKCCDLEELDSLRGTCSAIQIRREAMGSGDAWIALAIGALCGWEGVLFALVGGSLLGLVFALLYRIRRGVPMPFGPSLILAALVWLFHGPQLLQAYLELIGAP